MSLGELGERRVVRRLARVVLSEQGPRKFQARDE